MRVAIGVLGQDVANRGRCDVGDVEALGAPVAVN